jgi:hypothetical protein
MTVARPTLRLLRWRRRAFFVPDGLRALHSDLLPRLHAVPLRQDFVADQVSRKTRRARRVLSTELPLSWRRLTLVEGNSWQAPFLRGWGNSTFVQWLRFLTVFAVLYILFTFNYTVFQSLAEDEYINDIRKSPYYNQPYSEDQPWHQVEPSYRTKELRLYAQAFDALTVGLCTVERSCRFVSANSAVR